MSRIELDAADQGSVDRARELLALSEALDTGAAARSALLLDIGQLRGAITILLRVIDGGESGD